MILWTIQTEQAFSKLKRTGMLQAGIRNVEDKDFIPAYRWLIRKMTYLISPPPKKTTFPLWAWYFWKGKKRRKPDLRAHCHLRKGQRGVRIEFECNPNDILLSDFELWHYVLNYWYLPESRKDDKFFKNEMKDKGYKTHTGKPIPDKRLNKKIIKSWDRIFDLDWHNPYYYASYSRKSIQASLWQLSIDQVLDVTHFKGR